MERKVSIANLTILDPMAKRFVVSECGLEDIDGQPPPSRSKIRRSKYKLIYTKKKTQGKISWEEVWKHIIMKLVE